MDATGNGLETELAHAVDALHSALQLAADASASIKTLLPKLGAIASLFDQLDAVVRSGREQIGSAAEGSPDASSERAAA